MFDISVFECIWHLDGVKSFCSHISGIKTDITYAHNFFQNFISIERTASDVFVAFLQVLPLRFSLKHVIVLYLQIFHA